MAEWNDAGEDDWSVPVANPLAASGAGAAASKTFTNSALSGARGGWGSADRSVSNSNNYADGGRGGSRFRSGGGGYNRGGGGSNYSDWRSNRGGGVAAGSTAAGYHRAPNNGAPAAAGDNCDADDGNLSLAVSSRDVSRIIGRGGANIRDLEQQSGARIQVDKSGCMAGGGGDGTAMVRFSGSAVSQERAKQLVSQLVAPPAGASENDFEARASAKLQQLTMSTARPVFDLKLALKMQAEGDKERWSDLPVIVKNFYHEQESVAALSEEQVAEIRYSLHEISVRCDDQLAPAVSAPIRSFEEAFADYPDILAELSRAGFAAPTPIQSQAWPVLLSGRDMIGIAQTGSGKTLAFLLPALIHTDCQPPHDTTQGGSVRRRPAGPTVLVLSPTRELAQQTEREVKRFNYHGIRSVCVYGGGDRRAQVKAVCAGVEIVIATPGRLNDLIQAGYIDLMSISYLVLDEADRMLDMGFEADIRKVLLDIRPDRQSVMTSATWPADVRRIADRYMAAPVHVVVGSLDLRACRTVEQVVIYCEDEMDKESKLEDYLFNLQPEDKVIVFFSKKVKANQLTIDFGTRGVDLQSIHGDRPQEEREYAIEDLQTGRCRVLFATDVASRGIDIPDITLIINFDFPRQIEDYVHRVGRTGRAGKYGRAVTFMTRQDWRSAAELIDILEKNQAEVPEFLSDMADRFSRMKERRGNEGTTGRGGERGRMGGRGGRSHRFSNDSSGMF